MEAKSIPLETPGLGVASAVAPPSETSPHDPLDIFDGYFDLADHHKIRGSISRTIGQLAELPEQTLSTAIDLGEIAWAETRRAKVEAFTRHEREAIERVSHTHFAGFKRSEFGFTSHNSQNEYSLQVMEREGTGAQADIALVATHGWFGRYETFAEQAHPEFMREFTQITYNRPGTDAGSVELVAEPNYTTADHWETNMQVAEAMIARAFDGGARRVVKIGHSFGGILDQLLMHRLAERHPEWDDKLIFVPTNTTWPKSGNVVNGSFLDRIPGSGPVIRSAIETGVTAASVMGGVHRRLRKREPDPVERADEELTGQVQEAIKVIMTVGYFDSMVGGDAKRDVYLASKGRAKQNDGRAMIMDGLAMLRVPQLPPTSEIRYPTFVVTGGHDQLLPDTGHTVAERFAKADPDNHLVREFFFRHSGHCTPMTEPRVFNSLLREIALDPYRVLDRFGTRRHYRQQTARAGD